MGLDLWFQEDVARILASAKQASTNSLGAVPALDPEVAEAYQAGFADAIRAVGIAFGISPAIEWVGGRSIREWKEPAHTVLNVRRERMAQSERCRPVSVKADAYQHQTR